MTPWSTRCRIAGARSVGRRSAGASRSNCGPPRHAADHRRHARRQVRHLLARPVARRGQARSDGVALGGRHGQPLRPARRVGERGLPSRRAHGGEAMGVQHLDGEKRRAPQGSRAAVPLAARAAVALAQTARGGHLMGARSTDERRPITGAPNYYVSADGTVWFSSPRNVKRGEHRPVRPKRYRQLGRDYLRVRLRVNGKDQQHYIAVLVLTAFVGDRPGSGYTAQYRDGNPLNCRADNLYWFETNSATVTLQDFIRAWESSATIREVSERTGMTYAGCTARCYAL